MLPWMHYKGKPDTGFLQRQSRCCFGHAGAFVKRVPLVKTRAPLARLKFASVRGYLARVPEYVGNPERKLAIWMAPCSAVMMLFVMVVFATNPPSLK